MTININNYLIYFIGRELKDTVIVAYLLEYYSQHAMENPGWMTTVSKALPLLFKYHYGLLISSDLFLTHEELVNFTIIIIILQMIMPKSYFIKNVLQIKITTQCKNLIKLFQKNT